MTDPNQNQQPVAYSVPPRNPIGHAPQQPVYVQVQPAASNGQAVTSMILGIVAIAVAPGVPFPFIGLIFAFLAVPPAVVGMILGHLGLKTAVALNGLGRGQAKAGLILSYITMGVVALTTLGWITSAVFAAIGISSS